MIYPSQIADPAWPGFPREGSVVSSREAWGDPLANLPRGHQSPGLLLGADLKKKPRPVEDIGSTMKLCINMGYMFYSTIVLLLFYYVLLYIYICIYIYI